MAKNILAHNADLPAAVFSLELAARPMFERGAAIAANVDAECVERIYRAVKSWTGARAGDSEISLSALIP